MAKLPSLTPKKIIKILRRNGFILRKQKGSHLIFKHSQTEKRVIVPLHNKDLPKGTFLSILKQAGISKK